MHIIWGLLPRRQFCRFLEPVFRQISGWHTAPTPAPAQASTKMLHTVHLTRNNGIAGYRLLRSMSSHETTATTTPSIDPVTFEAVCSETLESLCDYFEELVEETSSLTQADVMYSDGVLTVNFGRPHGTYVINRQSPNRQIWLSSPTSGPKRYDFVSSKDATDKGYWLYRHDGVTLHELLHEEVSKIAGRPLDLSALPHSQREP
ncbi:frataxin homolog, mitochondrial-like [Anopheles albimanus]|nr:frataxin homolog, mitochondrial-like [Anopheles albimanus]